MYLTSIPPSVGKAAIAFNNYDGQSGHRMSRGDVDRVVEVKVPLWKLTKERTKLGRSIYTTQGPVRLPPREGRKKTIRKVWDN